MTKEDVCNVCQPPEVEDEGLIESMAVDANVQLPSDPEVDAQGIDWAAEQLKDSAISRVIQLVATSEEPSKGR